MDINLPFYDGFYWCRDIRTISKVPIIFLSTRSSDMDQVMAIENGRRFSESTGMGMYLAQKICSNLGHSITVGSDEGNWTEFTIVFYTGGNIFKM